MRLTLLFCLFSFQIINAQNDTMPPLPYYEIPTAPEDFNACTVAARMIDGLGFRYYWATEGLREEDLKFQPTEASRTTGETIEHIYGLSMVTLNAIRQKPNIQSVPKEELSFIEHREKTLLALKKASDLLRNTEPSEMENFNIVFQRADQSSEYPFWNILNGPLADAIWHVGQVVSHRRSSGNPLNGKVSVFSGKLRQ